MVYGQGIIPRELVRTRGRQCLCCRSLALNSPQKSLRNPKSQSRSQLIFFYGRINSIAPGIDTTGKITSIREAITAKKFCNHRAAATGSADNHKWDIVLEFVKMLWNGIHFDQLTANVR